MSDINCPYCDSALEINHDDGYGYDEGQKYEQECGDCGKTFVFETAISFDYTVSKADCLNDGEHRYKLTTTIPKEATRQRCEDCGHEMPMTEVQRKEILEPKGHPVAEALLLKHPMAEFRDNE